MGETKKKIDGVADSLLTKALTSSNSILFIMGAVAVGIIIGKLCSVAQSMMTQMDQELVHNLLQWGGLLGVVLTLLRINDNVKGKIKEDVEWRTRMETRVETLETHDSNNMTMLQKIYDSVIKMDKDMLERFAKADKDITGTRIATHQGRA